MITENVPIFEERPAYFWSSANVWLYDIITGIDDQGRGKIKGQKSWYIKWQYEKPELI